MAGTDNTERDHDRFNQQERLIRAVERIAACFEKLTGVVVPGARKRRAPVQRAEHRPSDTDRALARRLARTLGFRTEGER